MWYIIKPILKLLFAILYITYKCIEYAFVLLLRLIFVFKWTKYSEMNNNAGEWLIDGKNVVYVTECSEHYSEQKNPIESYKWIICEYFKN